jgi:hypothetical protein
MRMPCWIVLLASLACAVPCLACDRAALDPLLDRAEDHLSWYEFWLDIDLREAHSELRYAIADLRELQRALAEASCASAHDVQSLRAAVVVELGNAMRKHARDALALRPW